MIFTIDTIILNMEVYEKKGPLVVGKTSKMARGGRYVCMYVSMYRVFHEKGNLSYLSAQG